MMLKKSPLFRYAGAIIGLVIMLANASNPPNGRTGAPFDGGTCANAGCHTNNPNGYDGNVTISGLPDPIAPNTSYSITLTMTATAGSPTKGGFQLVAVQGNNANAGDLTAGTGSGTEFSGGREYVEQRGAQTLSGGSTSWTFTWLSPASSSGNTVTFYFIGNFVNGTGNSSGDYPVSNSESFSFQGSAPLTASVTTTPASCNGGNDGTATVTAGGGLQPYSYAWSNGQTTETAVNLAAGNYIVTVTDNAGSTKTASGTVTQPTAIQMSISAAGTITCNNPTVTATANATGGSPGYTYQWSDGTTGNILTASAGGIYTVTATDTHGCTKTTQTNILSNTTAPVASATGGTLTCTVLATTVTATSSATGSSYAWSGPGGFTASTQTATVSLSGIYTVTVTSPVNGCTATATANVGANTAPPTVSATSGSLTCNAPSTTISATSSAPNSTYLWAGPNGFSATTQSASVTMTGAYTVTVTNVSNGCTNTATTTVSGNLTPPQVSATGGTLTCAAPSIQISASTTTAPAQFSWAGPGGFSSSLQSPTVSTPGVYTVTVTSVATGCTNTATATVTIDQTIPNLSTTVSNELSCLQTICTICANSTTPNLVYSWNGPNGWASILQCPQASAPGAYTVTATNAVNGCTATATVMVTANITAPSVTVGGGTLTCSVTTVTLSASSSTLNAAYSWTGPNGFASNLQNPTASVAGFYTVVVTDPSNGCTAQATATVAEDVAAPGASAIGGTLTCLVTTVTLNGNSPSNGATFAWAGPGNFTSTQQNPTTSAAGIYTLTTTGPNGCTSTATATVSENTALPTASIAPAGNLNCMVSLIQLDGAASSQGANFEYQWTTANGNITGGANTLTPTVDAAGTYTLSVMNNANGCASTASATIGQTPPVAAEISGSQDALCNGQTNGSATANGTGGAGTLSYAWSNGTSGKTATGLAAGTYIVTVTDDENCTATATATIGQPDVLAANASTTSETSNGANDGTATCAPIGGTTPYAFAWSNGGSAETITGLAPGNYTVTATDANGCSAEQTVTVNAFGCAISATASGENVSCHGNGDGTATAAAIGGNGPFTYLWSNGGTEETIENLVPGNYTVEILDAAGCPASASVNITEPPVLAANATATPVSANGATDGAASANPTGGNAPYEYLWNTGATTASISGLAPGVYTVSVSDQNGCLDIQGVTVNGFDCNISTSIASVDNLCAGDADGQATASIAGGTAPFTYAWSNGGTTATITGLAAGTYTVSIVDAAGCVAQQSTQISAPAPLVLTTLATDVVCLESTDGSATVAASGGTAPYFYVWSNGSVSETATGLGVGVYDVLVLDNNGCAIDATVQIKATDNVPPTLICPQDITVCEGGIIQFGSAIATDNCALQNNAVVQTCGPVPGTPFLLGTTQVCYQATDSMGNTSSCSFTVEVLPLPTIVPIAQVTDESNGLGNGAINLDMGIPGNYAYHWTGPNGFTANTQDISGLHAGVYIVIITSTTLEGCTATTAMTFEVKNLVGTLEASPLAALRLLPNPAFEQVRLENPTGAYLLGGAIFDARGRMVKAISEAEMLDILPIAGLPSGMYHLRAVGENGQAQMLRFVKQ